MPTLFADYISESKSLFIFKISHVLRVEAKLEGLFGMTMNLCISNISSKQVVRDGISITYLV